MHPFNQSTINMSAANNSLVDKWEWSVSKTTAVLMVADKKLAEFWAPDFTTHPTHIDAKMQSIFNEYNDKPGFWGNKEMLAEYVAKVEAHVDLVDYINGLLQHAEFVECCAQGEGL